MAAVDFADQRGVVGTCGDWALHGEAQLLERREQLGEGQRMAICATPEAAQTKVEHGPLATGQTEGAEKSSEQMGSAMRQ